MISDFETFSSYMASQVDKMEQQHRKVTFLAFADKISSKRARYAEQVVMLDFIFKEAVGLAHLGDEDKAALSLAEGKRVLDGIARYIMKTNSPPSLYDIARRRYDTVLRKVEFILENPRLAA